MTDEEAERRRAIGQRLKEGRERAAAQKTRGRPTLRLETAPMPREATPTTDPEVEDAARYGESSGDYLKSWIADAEAYERQIRRIESGEIEVTRESNTGIPKTFDVPEQGKRPGWDYQWWPFKVMSREVDRSELVEIQRGGWIEVHPRDFPSLMPMGYRGRTIERQGCRLYMRPMRLTEEARRETFQHAYEAKQARLRAAQAGDAGREFAPRDPRGGTISTTLEPLL